MAAAAIAPPTSSEHTQHILPAPFQSSDLTLLAQGAEALVYRTTFLTPSTPCVLKYRPPKPYRHPILDKRLTRARLLAEARVLVKCRREGVSVPSVLGLDAENGWLVLGWVEGGSVRSVLDGWVQGAEGRNFGYLKEEGDGEQELWEMMRRIGHAVGRMHDTGVCHGDLTTSNLMVRTAQKQKETITQQEPQSQSQPPPVRMTPSQMREAAMNGDPPPEPKPKSTPKAMPTSTSNLTGEIILIDFGLAATTIQDEDRAVDLYVLERAFAATHPGAERLFDGVLRAYGTSYKGGKAVLRKLEEVRLRGRKRSMLG